MSDPEKPSNHATWTDVAVLGVLGTLALLALLILRVT